MNDYHGFENSIPSSATSSDAAWRVDAQVSTTARETAIAARFELARLVDALPHLGAVLWLERRARHAPAVHAAIGSGGVLLIDHPALAMIGRCGIVRAHSAITPYGPREWLDFRDDSGVAQAKLFLLPDTDYLAWDEMIARSHVPPAPEPAPRWQAQTTFLRCALAHLGTAWRARLLVFDLKRLPWLRTLGARPPLRISLLGLEIARAITRAERAEFISPLHTR